MRWDIPPRKKIGLEGSHGTSTRTRIPVLPLYYTPLPVSTPQKLALKDLVLIPKIYLVTKGTQQGLLPTNSSSASLKFSFSSKSAEVKPLFLEILIPVYDLPWLLQPGKHLSLL